MFKAIIEYSRKDIIVDSSKRLDNLKKLSNSGLFDLKIIFLIRECQGFLYSAKKRQYTGVVKPILDDNGVVVGRVSKKKFLNGPLKSGILWFMENMNMINFLKKILHR